MVTKTPDTVTAAVGRIIDYELRKRRISRSEAASKLGMGRETLRRRIEGSQGFQLDELEILARLLDTDASTLVAYAEKIAGSTPNMKVAG